MSSISCLMFDNKAKNPSDIRIHVTDIRLLTSPKQIASANTAKGYEPTVFL